MGRFKKFLVCSDNGNFLFLSLGKSKPVILLENVYYRDDLFKFRLANKLNLGDWVCKVHQTYLDFFIGIVNYYFLLSN